MGAGRESSYMPNKTRKRAFRIGRSCTGLGLFATAPIMKGAFIVEYKGRKLTTEQADKLEARGNRYLYEINSRWAIDGTSRKNLGRYANHSCRPNAETHRIGHKVIIRAIKNIKASAEITYNYGRDYLTNVAGLDFIFHKDGMIELTEAGFRRWGRRIPQGSTR
jgi:SET domain-containing protein